MNLVRFVPLLLICITMLNAHPHIFVESRVDLVFDAKGFASVRNHWTFDELYSKAMLEGADKDKNGKLSPVEVDWVWEQVLQPMRKFDYFNYLVLGTGFVATPSLTEFSATIEKGRLACVFSLPFRVPAGPEYSMLLLVLADPANYTQMTVHLDKSEVKSPAGLEVDYFVDGVADMTLFKGLPATTQGVFFRFRRTP